MTIKVNIDKVYKPSEDVVAREIQGEFIVIPIASGANEQEEEICSLNETGKAIWRALDGKRTLREACSELLKEFDVSKEKIEKETVGVVEDLLKRKMLRVI